MRFPKILGVALLTALLASPALPRCIFSIPIAHITGNIITNPERDYGGWFWVAGKGNNLVNEGSEEPEAGIDSGLAGGVPLNSDPRHSATWLVDPTRLGAIRMIQQNWRNSGLDGCADLNSNYMADPDEVMALLVVDERGEEYAMLSVAGSRFLGSFSGWFFDNISNGVPSLFGHPTSGVPMSPVPRPWFGPARDAGGGKVTVQVRLPRRRQIRTYDDIDGRRPMVQGFQLIQDEVLLAEVTLGTPQQIVDAIPGEILTLRTIFGASGDKGFYVDGEGRVPHVGETPQPPEDPGKGRQDDRLDGPGHSR